MSLTLCWAVKNTAGWAEVIPDMILATLYAYLIIRILTSSDAYFKSPFFIFFTTTGLSNRSKSNIFIEQTYLGIYSIISVISYMVVAQFLYTEKLWTVYIFKIAFVRTFSVENRLLLNWGRKCFWGYWRHVGESADCISSLFRHAN